jgi:hypothetical protein
MHTPKRVFDVELFESAAKAAGITLEWWDDEWWDDGESLNPGYIVNSEGDWVSWDPLSDDGDALRLAVKLGLEVHPSPRGCSVLWDVPGGKQVLTVLNRVVGCDSEGSTRLAITRAAAEIGRRMKS